MFRVCEFTANSAQEFPAFSVLVNTWYCLFALATPTGLQWFLTMVSVFIPWITNEIACAVFLVAQLCPTLCDPMDCSPPGSSVHGILQARILEWAAVSRGSSRSRDRTQVSHVAGGFFTIWTTMEAPWDWIPFHMFMAFWICSSVKVPFINSLACSSDVCLFSVDFEGFSLCSGCWSSASWMWYNISLHCVAYLFAFVIVFFHEQRFLILMGCKLYVSCFCAFAFFWFLV